MSQDFSLKFLQPEPERTSFPSCSLFFKLAHQENGSDPSNSAVWGDVQHSVPPAVSLGCRRRRRYQAQHTELHATLCFMKEGCVRFTVISDFKTTPMYCFVVLGAKSPQWVSLACYQDSSRSSCSQRARGEALPCLFLSLWLPHPLAPSSCCFRSPHKWRESPPIGHPDWVLRLHWEHLHKQGHILICVSRFHLQPEFHFCMQWNIGR